jgi:ABC-2 type transport system permease protein
MSRLLYFELLKIFKKWRTYIGFIAIGILVPLIEIVLYFTGDAMMEGMTRGLQQDFLLIGNLFNGWFITHLIMNSLWIHIPFLICLVAGDVLAGEATAGTFRILLIRPASRTRILFSKYFATLIYTSSLIVFLAVLSLGLGHILLGNGDLAVFSNGLLVLPSDDLLWRFLISFILAIFSMWVVASLAFFFSSFVENAIGPIVGTMAVIIIFFILGNLPYDFFVQMKPYLFTSYFGVWQLMFEDPVNWNDVSWNILILGGYLLLFFLPSLYIFKKKDILS